MSSLVPDRHQAPRSSGGRLLGVAVLALCSLAAFLFAPGSIASKTHMALHGLCAQRPSHSLQLGGATLPLDARMTGIYIGAATALVWLLAVGRLRSTRSIPVPVLATLVGFVIAVGIDGVNALLVDLGSPHSYEPANTLRLVTGLLGGTALGVALGHLFAVSIWTRGDRQEAVVGRPTQLLTPIGVSAVFGLLALSGLPILYAPMAVGLTIAALGVFWIIGMIVVSLVSDREWSCDSYGDVTPIGIAGLSAAVLAIAALSWLRFFAESVFGLARLT